MLLFVHPHPDSCRHQTASVKQPALSWKTHHKQLLSQEPRHQANSINTRKAEKSKKKCCCFFLAIILINTLRYNTLKSKNKKKRKGKAWGAGYVMINRQVSIAPSAGEKKKRADDTWCQHAPQNTSHNPSTPSSGFNASRWPTRPCGLVETDCRMQPSVLRNEQRRTRGVGDTKRIERMMGHQLSAILQTNATCWPEWQWIEDLKKI